jgi:hypothetical protein
MIRAGDGPLDIQKVIAAINVDLADVTANRLFAYDPTHVYLFKGGFDALSRAGSRAIPLPPIEVEGLYYKFRQRRIDAALERMARDMLAADAGSAEKTDTGYVVREGGKIFELTNLQFVMLARDRSYIAEDDPFFCVDTYRWLAGWDGG